MNNNYKESFEQTKIAGNLAAQALDEVTSYVQKITEDIQLHFFIEGFQNLAVLL